MSIKQEHRVEVDNGKYTFVVPSNDDRVHILRHGEPWYTPEVGQPSNALHAIMCELDAARVVIQAARELVRKGTTLNYDDPLVEALTKHAALTVDHISPSLWTERASSQFQTRPETETVVDPVRRLMSINAQMFVGTIRVLGQQNMTLHGQVAQLTADNVNLLHELEEARPKIDKDMRTNAGFQKLLQIGTVVAAKAQKTVREYLNELVWDQKPRIERWLIDYAGAADTEYVRTVSRKVLIAAVRRARQPGCRFDSMLILESPQGTGKSRALRILAVEDAWFADKLPLDAREILETTAGKWIVEVSELSLLSQEDVGALKTCLSRQHDEARLAYQATVSRVPRQFLIVGTMNATESFIQEPTEPTGNRRFLWVRVQRFDLERLRTDRDQLWAEAAAAEAAGEALSF